MKDNYNSEGVVPKTITIEEDYLEFHGQIYYAWREEAGLHWHFKLTPHQQLPYIKWSSLSEIEYKDRLRRFNLDQPKLETTTKDYKVTKKKD